MTLNAIKEKVCDTATYLGNSYKVAGMAGLSTALVAVPALTVFAEETPGTNLLEGEVMTAVSSGFADLKATVVAIVAIAATTGIAIVGVSAGVKYAIKKIKGTLSSAG